MDLPEFKECTPSQKTAYIIAVVFSIVSLYFGLFPEASIIQQIVHLLFASTLVFLIFQRSTSSKLGFTFKIIDGFVLILSTLAALYLLINYKDIIWRVGNLTTIDLTAGAIIIISVLYGTKRVIGWALPILGIIFILYAIVGRYLPGYFQHGGYDFNRIISHIFLTEDGIYGSPLRASATLVIFFLIFAAFFERAGGGTLVIQLANGLFGWMRGGPAKVAVVASSLFGSISGSAVANTVGTGSLTIPMMKKIGYKPHFAGAVEAVSSTGGQYMPPIMGAAAFIMAEILGVSYSEIVIAAIVPAILYFLAVFIMVHYEAKRLNISGLKKSELPSIKNVLAEYGHMLFPLLGLIYMLVFLQYSPARSALFTITFTIIFSFFRKSTRLGIKAIFECLKKSATGVIQVAMATACAGIVVGVFSLTGLGLKISYILINLSGGSMLILLILTAITSILLGMGMPTVGAYLVLAILIAPTLIDQGINPIAAHLFIFYFGNLSNITPPVALAAYAASGIAGSNAFQTGWTATRLAVSAFILPFLFVYGEGLLFIGSKIDVLMTIVTATLGIFFLSIGLQKFLSITLTRTEQIMLIVAALLLIKPGMVTGLLGIILGGIAVILNIYRGKHKWNLSDNKTSM